MDMENKPLFRAEASKASESLEKFDESLKVVSNFGWLSLLAGGVIFLFTLTWGFYGSIEEKVSGLGLLTSTGAVPGVYPYTEGIVKKYHITVGDTVKKGQLLATFSVPQYSSLVEEGQQVLENLKNNHSTLTQIEEAELNIELESIEFERIKLESNIKDSKLQLKIYNDQAASGKQLFAEGVMSEDNYQNAVSTAMEYSIALKKLLVQLDQLSTQISNSKTSYQNSLQQRQLQIHNQEATLTGNQENLDAYSTLVAGFDGTITEISVQVDETVSPNQPVVLMEKGKGQKRPLEAIVFVTSIEAKKILVGDETEISPTIIRPSEYGSIVGKVKSISSYPVTEQRLKSLFNNQTFISEVTASGTPLEVHVELARDTKTPSGYNWTSGKGPNFQITNGTLVNGMVVVRSRMPISFIMPFLRKFFLGEDSEGIYND